MLYGRVRVRIMSRIMCTCRWSDVVKKLEPNFRVISARSVYCHFPTESRKISLLCVNFARLTRKSVSVPVVSNCNYSLETRLLCLHRQCPRIRNNETKRKPGSKGTFSIYFHNRALIQKLNSVYAKRKKSSNSTRCYRHAIRMELLKRIYKITF